MIKEVTIESFMKSMQNKLFNFEKAIKKVIHDSEVVQKLNLKNFVDNKEFQEFIMLRIMNELNKKIISSIKETNLNNEYYVGNDCFFENIDIELINHNFKIKELSLKINFMFKDRYNNNSMSESIYKEEKINVSLI